MLLPFKRRTDVLLTLALFTLASFAVQLSAQTSGSHERFTAFAVDTANWGATRAGTLEVTVSRWSTTSEQAAFIETLRERGSAPALEWLRHAPRAGFVRTPGNLGWALRLAQQVPGEDGGRKILLVTDRPADPLEAFAEPSLAYYPFMVIEMQMPPDTAGQEGQGTFWPAAQLSAVKYSDTLWVDSYSYQPVRLMAVRSYRGT